MVGATVDGVGRLAITACCRMATLLVKQISPLSYVSGSCCRRTCSHTAVICTAKTWTACCVRQRRFRHRARPCHWRYNDSAWVSCWLHLRQLSERGPCTALSHYLTTSLLTTSSMSHSAHLKRELTHAANLLWRGQITYAARATKQHLTCTAGRRTTAQQQQQTKALPPAAH